MKGYLTREKFRWKDNIFVLFSMALPVIFTFLWLSKNSQLPASDATDYLGTGLKIYRLFMEKNLWTGFWQMPHGWRPIFFPLLSVPFLFLSQGNVYFAYQAVALSCVITSGVYVYLLLRLQLTKWSAIVGANLICLLPLFQGPILAFFSEAALFPCLLASIYHLIQSNYLRDKKHTLAFTVFLTLAVIIRPVEAVSHLFFIFAYFFMQGWKKQIFSGKQILTVMALCLSALSLFFIVNAGHFLNHYGFKPIDGGVYDIKLTKLLYHALIASSVMTIIAWGAVGLANHLSSRNRFYQATHAQQSSYILVAMSSAMLVALAWYLPKAFVTLLWIFRTSVGDVANVTQQFSANHTFVQEVARFAFAESELIVIGASIVALISMLVIPQRERLNILSANAFLYLILLLPFPLWEVFFTVQSTVRKLSVAFPALLMVMLLFGLAKGPFKWLRLIVMSVLLLLQFSFAMSYVYPDKFIEPLKLALGGYPVPVVTTPNSHVVVINFLAEQAKQYSLHHVYIEADVEHGSSVDTFLLIFMNDIAKNSYKISYPYFSQFSSNNAQKLSLQTDGLFLTDKVTAMTISPAAAQAYAEKFANETNPTIKTLYQFLMYFSQNKLADIGWQKGPCIVVKASNQQNYLGCLLLPNKSNNKNMHV